MEDKNTIAVSLENLETFKDEMNAAIDKKIEAISTPSVTFATTAQIKVLFAEAPAEENA